MHRNKPVQYLHVGFVVDETGSRQVFLGVSPVFPYHKFHSTISPHSSHPFRFISSTLVMVRKAWSAGTLVIHGPIIQGLHRISSLDPRIFIFIFVLISRTSIRRLAYQYWYAYHRSRNIRIRTIEQQERAWKQTESKTHNIEVGSGQHCIVLYHQSTNTD